MAFHGRWAPYVRVERRRANAAREASKLAKQGHTLRPIHIRSVKIATSFWGIAWCKNLEVYADWANRMPRGRTYARNGSIVDLQIEPGEITSLVSGSSLYKIKISIDRLDAKTWKAIRTDCARQVASLLDLMRGKLPDAVLQRLTDPKAGIFPRRKELKLRCSCPDSATMCKHVAATLYGVGHLLDTEPELFFRMRGVDQSELVSDAMTTQATADAMGLDQQSSLVGEDLGAIFGIDLAAPDAVPAAASTKAKSTKRTRIRGAQTQSKVLATTETTKETTKGVTKSTTTKNKAKKKTTKAKTKTTTEKAATKVPRKAKAKRLKSTARRVASLPTATKNNPRAATKAK